jgi:hypothetical protein
MELLIPVHMVADRYLHNYTVVFFSGVFGPAALSVGGRGAVRLSLPTHGPVPANLKPYFRSAGGICASRRNSPAGYLKSRHVGGGCHTYGGKQPILCSRRAPLPGLRKGSSWVILKTVASDGSKRRAVNADWKRQNAARTSVGWPCQGGLAKRQDGPRP